MRRAHWALKLILSLTLAALLFYFVDVRAALSALWQLGARGLSAVIALTVVVMIIGAWRFQRILHHLGEDLAFTALLGDTLVGTAYNLLLPTTIGGDVARGLRSADRAKQAPHVWAALAFERMLGLVTLALMSLVGVVVLSSVLPFSLLLPCVLVVVLITVVALGLPRLLHVAARRWARGPAGKVLSVSALALAEALNGPLAKNQVRLETLGSSLLYQLVSLTILAVVVPDPSARHVLGIYAGVPLALIAAMAPITLGGVGLRESLFVIVLRPFGYSAEQALLLALVWLGSSLMAALAGALVLAAERRTQVVT